MKCPHPHCDADFHDDWRPIEVVDTRFMHGEEGTFAVPGIKWMVHHQRCPRCHEIIIFLTRTSTQEGVEDLSFMAYPPRSSTRRIPPEVPDPYRQDFSEACKVLADSAKASAALSRRCLQAILRDELGAKSKFLDDQIDEVKGKFPTYISEGLHAVRNIGNFAAHPMKSMSTGTIVDVEPTEAEWTLEVVERLFDFCFVQPAIAAKRTAELNEKLRDMNKPTIP
jgi:hypothetical protein